MNSIFFLTFFKKRKQLLFFFFFPFSSDYAQRSCWSAAVRAQLLCLVSNLCKAIVYSTSQQRPACVSGGRGGALRSPNQT